MVAIARASSATALRQTAALAARLAANASKYGFARTVPSEPWHWEFRR